MSNINNKLYKSKLILQLKTIQKELFKIYKRLFDDKYKSDNEFRSFIDKKYDEDVDDKDNREGWNEKLCSKATYIILNKILLLNICKENGVLDGSVENIVNLIMDYTLDEIIGGIYNTKDLRSNIYNYDKYEVINYKNKYFTLKYLANDGNNKTEYENLINFLNSIIKEMDKNNLKDMENILGDLYESMMDKETRKKIGQFYTPDFIIKFIILNTIKDANVLENPFVKVVDISCGTGNFLIKAYDILKEKFYMNIKALREKYYDESYILSKNDEKHTVKGNEYWVEENIHYHILKNCIYGADTDSFAVQLTKLNLILKDLHNLTTDLNIIECDSLIRWESDYGFQDLKKQIKNHEILCKNEVSMYISKDENKKTTEKKIYKIKYKDMSGSMVEKNIDIHESEKIITICEFWSNKFDYVIGNPPYVGHKQLTEWYKKWLMINYKYVFKDKSDLSFCFFSRIISILNNTGKASIITTRYFMESPNGKSLRIYLKEKSNIESIVDFYGGEIFKGVGIATAIYTFTPYNNKEKSFLVSKLLNDKFVFESDMNLEELKNTNLFENFYVKRDMLKEERWTFISSEQNNIYSKILNASSMKLGEIAESFQGIITGCDKAFVMDEEEATKNGIEKGVLKTWIKSSHINKYKLSNSNLNLIYSNSIKDGSNFINSLNFIKQYKDKLENRRECKKGIRKWYELQWGRNEKIFEQKKIVFPYKSKNNRFALDSKGVYYSADVYSLTLKNTVKNNVSLEYLVGILNSEVYEFYFKLFGKKMGRGIYDYYPNSIMDLKIITDYNIMYDIELAVKQIINIYDDIEKINIKNEAEDLYKKIDGLNKKINNIIYESLKITKEEEKFITAFIK